VRNGRSQIRSKGRLDCCGDFLPRSCGGRLRLAAAAQAVYGDLTARDGPLVSISGIKALFPESHDYWRIVYNALRPGRHENLPDGAAVA